MTPNEQLKTSPAGHGGGNLTAARAASTICLLAGIWFFISPWIYTTYANLSSWNSWIVGGLMILFSIVRLARPAYSTLFGWFNMVLGIWTFFSPWIYNYTAHTGRFINSLCVGVIVFVLSIVSVMMSRKTNTMRSSTIASH
jgi:SPW repeat